MNKEKVYVGFDLKPQAPYMFFIIDRLQGIIIHKIQNHVTYNDKPHYPHRAQNDQTCLIKGLEVYKNKVLAFASQRSLSFYELDNENGIIPYHKLINMDENDINPATKNKCLPFSCGRTDNVFDMEADGHVLVIGDYDYEDECKIYAMDFRCDRHIIYRSSNYSTYEKVTKLNVKFPIVAAITEENETYYGGILILKVNLKRKPVVGLRFIRYDYKIYDLHINYGISMICCKNNHGEGYAYFGNTFLKENDTSEFVTGRALELLSNESPIFCKMIGSHFLTTEGNMLMRRSFL